MASFAEFVFGVGTRLFKYRRKGFPRSRIESLPPGLTMVIRVIPLILFRFFIMV